MRLLYALGILEGGEISSIHNPRVPYTVFSPYECEWIWAQSSKGLWDDDCHDITATADFSDPVFERYLVSLIQRHLLVQGTPRFINKNPVHCLRMGYLQNLFPEARFVTIVRDPVDTVLSHYRTSAHMQRILFVDEQTQHLFQEELHVDMLTARIKTRHYERTLSLDKIHPLLGIANQWLDLEGAVLESAAHTPALADQVLALRYETLVSQPEQTLESIWDFIELQGEEAEQITRVYAPQLSPSPAAALSAEEKEFLPRVREIVASLATQLGYA